MDEIAIERSQKRYTEKAVLMNANEQPAEIPMSELYQRYVIPIYNYLYSQVHNVAEAEDLTSKTFLVALESRSKLRDPARFAGWIFRIARNKAIDHFRQSKIRQVEPLFDEEFQPTAKFDWTAESDREELITIRGLLQKLNPEDQELIHLRLAAGLQFREIATVLNSAENRIKKRYYRVIEQLRAQAEV